jgi:hypothetical protein
MGIDMIKFFKGLGSTGNAAYEAARQAVHKDLKIQRLQQEVDDLKAARKDLIQASMQLIKVKDVAVNALTAIGNQETSGGGQASTMVWTAREALKKINEELDKTK